MASAAAAKDMLLCPSAQPEMAGGVVFGVVGGTVEAPRVGYLEKPVPVTEEVLRSSGQVKPTEVFRLAARCAGHSCQHFDGVNCGLATRVVKLFGEVVTDLPPCTIRPNCRWWRQEGKAACLRCPQVVTESYNATDLQQRVAKPER